VSEARQGRWRIHLSDTKPVPREWLGDVGGRRILCLAGGGGQHGPILAAAGAQVVVVDASSGELAQDQAVAERDGLDLTGVQGDMADLSMFSDEEFDLIVNPSPLCSCRTWHWCGVNATAHFAEAGHCSPTSSTLTSSSSIPTRLTTAAS
jgi:hypothetical protein